MTLTRFSTRRGRPKSAHHARDLGTPEPILKRACGLTHLALDACLARGFLQPDEHRAGMRFRGLYFLRYGSPHPTALDPSRLRGLYRPLSEGEGSAWRQAKEAKWAKVSAALHAESLYAPLHRLCIDDLLPRCLSQKHQAQVLHSRAAAHRLLGESEQLHAAFALLQRMLQQKRGEKTTI